MLLSAVVALLELVVVQPQPQVVEIVLSPALYPQVVDAVECRHSVEIEGHGFRELVAVQAAERPSVLTDQLIAEGQLMVLLQHRDVMVALEAEVIQVNMALVVVVEHLPPEVDQAEAT